LKNRVTQKCAVLVPRRVSFAARRYLFSGASANEADGFRPGESLTLHQKESFMQKQRRDFLKITTVGAILDGNADQASSSQVGSTFLKVLEAKGK